VSEQQVGVQERLGWLRRTAWAWLLAVLLLVLALAVGVSSSLGVFTSSSPNPGNVVTSGSMSQTNTADNAAIMGASGMVPGDSVEGTASVTNEGDARGEFTLTVDDIDDRPGPAGGKLSAALRLRVTDTGSGDTVYTGPLRGLDASLGTWQPDEARSYRLVVTFPDGSGNDDYQGSAVTVTFVWQAVQAT
jgi:hypothetical protein